MPARVALRALRPPSSLPAVTTARHEIRVGMADVGARMLGVVEVHRAGAEQWQIVKQARLSALADAPRAFGSTLAREVAFDDEVWRRRVGAGDWFLAWDGHEVVGMAAGITEEAHPTERHLVGMWVRADHRGGAAACSIVEAVCGWAWAQGAEAVSLWVADGNDRARRFYERLGFTSTGQRQPLPSAPDVGEERLRRIRDRR